MLRYSVAASAGRAQAPHSQTEPRLQKPFQSPAKTLQLPNSWEDAIRLRPILEAVWRNQTAPSPQKTTLEPFPEVQKLLHSQQLLHLGKTDGLRSQLIHATGVLPCVAQVAHGPGADH
jgi:hypothetical protein